MSLLADLERLAGWQAELTGQAQICLGLLRQEEMGPLEDAMRRRRRLHSQMVALFQNLQRSCPDLEEALAALPPGQADLARRRLRSLEEQVGRMQALDQESAGLLEAIMARMRQQLGRLGQGQRLLNAYRALPAGVGWGPDQLSRTG